MPNVQTPKIRNLINPKQAQKKIYSLARKCDDFKDESNQILEGLGLERMISDIKLKGKFLN